MSTSASGSSLDWFLSWVRGKETNLIFWPAISTIWSCLWALPRNWRALLQNFAVVDYFSTISDVRLGSLTASLRRAFDKATDCLLCPWSIRIKTRTSLELLELWVAWGQAEGVHVRAQETTMRRHADHRIGGLRWAEVTKMATSPELWPRCRQPLLGIVRICPSKAHIFSQDT